MPSRIARIFTNGGSQAVRLPAEFRFDTDEVYVRRDERTGDVILSKKSGWTTWQEYFQLRGKAEGVPAEFMKDRPLNTALGDKELFGEDQ